MNYIDISNMLIKSVLNSCKIFYLLVVFSSVIFTQNDISFEKISNEQGLSQNSIMRILQDSRGFLWIGTQNGLNRYDGYQFKIFRSLSTDSASLSNNKVLSICEDKSGTIWIGTYGGGLNKYDRRKESFKRYQYNSGNLNSLSSNIVTSIIQDDSGFLWLGTLGGGLNLFDPDKENFIHYKYDIKNENSISSNNIISVFEDAAGTLWIGTLYGLNRFNKESESFEVFNFDINTTSSISSDKISSIIEDNSGKMWIGTFDGGLNMFYSPKFSKEKNNNKEINFYHFKREKNNSKSISSNGVFSVYQDRWGDIWVGTDGKGLNKLIIKNQSFDRNNFNSDDYKFIHYKHDPNNNYSLSDDRVWSIYEDRSGILWIGTNAGLNKIDIQKNQFTSFTYDPLNPGSLSDGDVSSILEDNTGNLWIGTGSGGLNLYDAKEKKIIKYKHDPSDPNSLSNDEVLSIFQDRARNLWIGTYDGLNKLSTEYVDGTRRHKTTPVFVRYKHDPDNSNSLSDNRVYSILEDKSGNLWVGTVDGGLNKLLKDSLVEDKKSSTLFKHYKHNPEDSTSISANRIFSIYEDSKGILWIGTWAGGLNKLVPGDNSNDSEIKFINYKNDPDDPNSLSDNGILSIYEDSDGILWIGTYGGGLNRFDRNTETFSHYTEKDGLSNNVVLGIAEDDNGNLWLSTIMKLNKFDPINKKFSHFQTSDGLPGNEFSLGVCKGSCGELYFGGTNGFIKFYPDSIKELDHESPVVITDFKIFNHSVPIGFDSSSNRMILSQSIIETKQINLNYDDYAISFEFASIDFHRPEKLSYFYKMEGFDKEWNQTDASRRFANYTNLDPGNYTFKVKTNNDDGKSNVIVASIRLIIHPPWWRTIWAYLFYIIFFVGSLFVLYKLKIRRIHLKHEIELSKFEAKKLHEIDEMKSNFFANISHEFRTPLTLILGPVKELINTEQVRERKEELKIVQRNADMLYGLVNQLMDLSKLEAGKMTLKTREVDIVPTLRGLVQSFSSLAEIKNISLKFNSEKAKIISYFDIDKVEKIFINILSNAFKFTDEGKRIKVNVKEQNGNIEIKISDEGVGIPKDRLDNIFDRFYQVDCSHTRAHEGTGIGLALTKELVELHKGKIEVESDEGKGSTFIVVLPLGKHHFTTEEVFDEEVEKNKEDALRSKAPTIPEDQSGTVSVDISMFTDSDKPLILIVEDNHDVRNYIKGHLEHEYRVLLTVNGEEGLNTAFEQVPDLIISDVMMPKLDGFKLCEKIKIDERTSHIPIILLTAKATGDDKIEGLETGADDYIMKPFDAKELQVRVKNLIDQRKKLAEHFRNKQMFDISDVNATSADKKFLTKAFEVIKNHVSDEEFNVEVYANEMALSRVQLHRKLVALVGHPPGDFIRIIRLTKASELIRTNFGNISEIALEVGFTNPANFAKAFRTQFGVSPSEFKNK